jgi:hypothetical protein
VAARTLEAGSPSEGHLARRYVPILRRMAGIVLAGNMQAQRLNSDGNVVVTDVNNQPEQLQNTGEAELWEIWQQAGLDSMFYPGLFDDPYVA